MGLINQAMLITAEMFIPFPRHAVYLTYRDQLVDLVPYLPNIRSVEVKLRRQDKEQVYTENCWHSGGGIPVALRAVLGETILSWTEYNTWHESSLTVEWRIETHAFTEAVFCAGKNEFLERDGGTMVKTQGELRIDPTKIKGLSPYLQRRIAGQVEKFLGKKIIPNLHQMSQGVQYYLEQKVI